MIEIIKTRILHESDLARIKEMWDSLSCGNDMTIFQSYDWNRLLFREWSQSRIHLLTGSCMLYAAKVDNKVEMIAPIIIQVIPTKTHWFGRDKGVYIIGNGSYSDYLSFIYSKFSIDAFTMIINCIRKDFPKYPIYLTDIREDTSLAQYLKDEKCTITRTKKSVAIRNKVSMEEYLLTLSKQTKQNLRTARNRMNRDGVSYRFEIMGRIEDEQLINKLIDIHTSRIISKKEDKNKTRQTITTKIKAIILRYKEKHNNIIRESMRQMNESCIVVVYLSGRIAGYLYGLKERNTSCIRIMQNCFNEEFKFYSPLFRGAYDFIIKEQYVDNRIEEIDFTRGDEEYKYRLGGEETLLYHFKI